MGCRWRWKKECFLTYLMLTLEACYDIVCKSVGSRLGVKTGEERGGGNHAHVGVVKALVGTERVESTDGCAIDQTSRDVVELSESVWSPVFSLTGWSNLDRMVDTVATSVDSRSSESGASSKSGEEGGKGLHGVVELDETSVLRMNE